MVEQGLTVAPHLGLLTTFKGVSEVFGNPAQVLGPAVLAYGTGSSQSTTAAAGPVSTSDPRVRAILERCSLEDQNESGLTNTDSGVFISVDSNGDPVSASGYRRWPESIAHMSALTVAAARGEGHGTVAAAAALSLATNNGLVAQWRAAEGNTASRSLARSLGLEPIGRQFGFRPPWGPAP